MTLALLTAQRIHERAEGIALGRLAGKLVAALDVFGRPADDPLESRCELGLAHTYFEALP